MRDECPIRNNLIVRQERVLRKASERGMTMADLSAETGIPVPTLNSYIPKPSRVASEMPTSAFIKIAKALAGAGMTDLASLLIEDTGLTLVERDPSSANWRQFATTLNRTATKISAALEDGHVDHREHIDLSDATRALISDAHGVVGA